MPRLLHLKMQVRITVSDERLATHAPVDTIGVVQQIELDPIDRARWLQDSRKSIFVLHYEFTVLMHINKHKTDTGLGPGIVAVETTLCQPFPIELKLKDPGCSRTRLLKVKAAREQVPVTIATASILYKVRDTTTTPGLNYIFRAPRRISGVAKWSAMA